MSDGQAGVFAIFLALSHVGIAVIAWAWAARSRHVGFLIPMGLSAALWAIAGFPFIRALTFATPRLREPRTGLEVAGTVALAAGTLGFIVCAVGALVTVTSRRSRLRSRRGRKWQTSRT